jgi:hypothetical protein
MAFESNGHEAGALECGHVFPDATSHVVDRKTLVESFVKEFGQLGAEFRPLQLLWSVVGCVLAEI